jgi:hypothetical protein
MKKGYVFYIIRLSYWCKMLCNEPLQRTDSVQYFCRILFPLQVRISRVFDFFAPKGLFGNFFWPGRIGQVDIRQVNFLISVRPMLSANSGRQSRGPPEAQIAVPLSLPRRVEVNNSPASTTGRWKALRTIYKHLDQR